MFRFFSLVKIFFAAQLDAFTATVYVLPSGYADSNYFHFNSVQKKVSMYMSMF